MTDVPGEYDSYLLVRGDEPSAGGDRYQRVMGFLEGYLPSDVLNRLPLEYRVWLYERLRGPGAAFAVSLRSWIPIPDSLLERLGGVEGVWQLLQRLPEEVRRALRQRVINANHDPNPRVL